MKYLKYTIALVAATLAFIGCEKHDMSFADSDPVGNNAMFQIGYFVPKAAGTTTRIDSCYLNGKLVHGATGAGAVAVNSIFPNGVPAGSSSSVTQATVSTRFFSAPSGPVTITFYNADAVMYEQTVNLNSGRYILIVSDLEAAPTVLDADYPFVVHSEAPQLSTFDSDSLATIRFYNFAFKGNASTPYPGKIQYQWCHDKSKGATGRGGADGNWQNIGDPVGFGEATIRQEIQVWKETYNSTGSEQLWFRGIDEAGNVIIADDYWTTFIGTGMNHMYRGIVGGSPKAGITLWGSKR